MSSLGLIRRADFEGYGIIPASAVESGTGRVKPVEPVKPTARTENDLVPRPLYFGKGIEKGGGDILV